MQSFSNRDCRLLITIAVSNDDYIDKFSKDSIDVTIN